MMLVLIKAEADSLRLSNISDAIFFHAYCGRTPEERLSDLCGK